MSVTVTQPLTTTGSLLSGSTTAGITPMATAGAAPTGPAADGVAALGAITQSLAGIVQAIQALIAQLPALLGGAGAGAAAGGGGGGALGTVPMMVGGNGEAATTAGQPIVPLSGATTTGGGAAVSQLATPMQQTGPAAGGAAMAGMKMPGLPTPPAKHDSRFLDGTVGPVVKKGKAEKVKIPDGDGFKGAKGRKQNADDKSKNNYSVTDANFSNQLGLLPADPDTGKKMTYVQHIQTYAAANYLEAYNHPLYAQLTANQNAGKGTILGAAAHIMGLVTTADPAEAGLDPNLVAQTPAKIPGTPMDAKSYIASGKDITGQDWARMHHAGSQFKVMSGLINAGLDWKDAMAMSGDDAISGSGRMNGVNTQDNNKSGLNNGEEEVYSKAAQLQQSTGIPVIQIMMGGHNHLGGDPSALTNPKINKILGDPKKERDASAERANAVYQSMLNGKVGNAKKAKKDGTTAKNKGLLKHATGAVTAPQPSPIATPGSKTGTLTNPAGGAQAVLAGGATTSTMASYQVTTPDINAAIAQLEQLLQGLAATISSLGAAAR